jgi:Zn-dependent M28 family amino/carboxypeptidase
MRAAVLLFTLTFGCSILPAQTTEASRSAGQRIIDATRGSTKAYEDLAYLTDNIGPRLSGSKQAEAAVRWSTAKLKEWGYEVQNEPVVVPHWVRGEEKGHLTSHMDQKIVLTALGGSIATPATGIDAEVIEVHSFDELTALGDKVKGKIVLFDVSMDMEKVRSRRAFEAYSETVIYRGVGASRAAAQGAVAALVRSVASASLRTPHTGSLRYDEKMPQIPAAAVTTEDAALIHRLITKGEKVTMHLVLTPQLLPDVPSANVIAELKGSDAPDEIVLIGAHLDSWDLGTGAIDDGSGVAMVMETMRLLKVLKLHPRRTIRAVLYINEENGLRGGRGYAELHKNELPKHVAAIETDAGAAAPLGFITTLDEKWSARLVARVPELAQLNATMMQHSAETGADTSPLTAAGIAGFGFVPDPLHYFDYHHTPADTLDKIDPKELEDDSAALAILAHAIADMPERLPLVAVEAEQ